LFSSGCAYKYNKLVVRGNPFKKVIVAHLTTTDWRKDYDAETDVDKKKALRNRIIDEFVWLVDDAYYQWEPSFYNTGATITTVFDFASLGLTGASSVANSPRVLGAMATSAG
jgi:hypothetical protein